MSEIAEPLPSFILADLFSIPEDIRKDFYAWSNNMTQFFGGASQYRNEDGIEVNQSAKNLRGFFETLVSERRKNPKEDFLSIMLKNQDSIGLTDQELISQAIMMLVAGQITTTDQLNNNLFTMLSERDSLLDLRSNVFLVPSAIEEYNRLDPGVTFLFRVAKADTTLLGQEIRNGETVFISNHAVNRDPILFPEPERCDIRRNPNPHFSYGNGSHYCLGAKLARIQMTHVFEKLL